MTVSTGSSSSGFKGMNVVDFEAVGQSGPGSGSVKKSGPSGDEIFRAIYISHTRVRLADEQLDAIMNDLYRRNTIQKISGLLLYKSRSFFEVLEGPQDIILPALDRIFQDRRHFKMKVMMYQQVKQRRFEGWSMGFRRLDGSVSRQPCYFNLTRRDLEQRFPRGASREILFFLRGYLTARFPPVEEPEINIECKVSQNLGRLAPPVAHRSAARPAPRPADLGGPAYGNPMLTPFRN
ncbi:BLUF domain-containing protein [Sagittula sp. S175]|uniref:BLUF domain-containing protein n=1 Tax=Sagittula sp. S175 TaxID=3415129 RepID=UPI003C7C0F19